MNNKSLNLILVAIFLVLMISIFFTAKSFSRTEGRFPQLKGFVGPGNCTTQEDCEAYCKINAAECAQWCQQNPEICKKYGGEAVEQKKFASQREGLRETRKKFEKPGIAISNAYECENWWYECKDFCAKPENSKLCYSFCEENPKVCGILEYVKLEMPLPIPKPDLTLAYYKGLVVLTPEVHKIDSTVKMAKELNANIISIFHETKQEHLTGKELSSETKIKDAMLINAAHESGLLIQYTLPCYFNVSKTPNDALPQYLSCVADYAKFAEDRGVYQILLHHELEILTGVFNYTNDKEKYAFMEKVSKDGLKEIRKFYTGKVGIGFCCSNDEYFNYDFSGYDYYSGMFYANAEKYADINNFIENSDSAISSWMKTMNKIRESYKINTLVMGETGVCNPDIKDPEGRSECTYMRTVPCNSDEEKLYYETIFEKTHNLVNGYFINYGFAIMNVKDEPAEDAVKEWYGKI